MSHHRTLARNALHHKETLLACNAADFQMKMTCFTLGVSPHTLRGYCRILGIPMWWQKHNRRKQP